MQEQKIIKYLKGKVSFSEEKEMEDWIVSSDQNKKKFNIIKARHIASTFNETSDDIEMDKAYNTFLDNMRIAFGTIGLQTMK